MKTILVTIILLGNLHKTPIKNAVKTELGAQTKITWVKTNTLSHAQSLKKYKCGCGDLWCKPILKKRRLTIFADKAYVWGGKTFHFSTFNEWCKFSAVAITGKEFSALREYKEKCLWAN